MRHLVKNIKLSLLAGLCTFSITACVPYYDTPEHSSHRTSDHNQAEYGYENAEYGYDYVSDYSAYGYENTGHGYDYVSNQSAYGYETPPRKSRYGGGLRGSCESVVQSCGMMAVVPVYPVYQVFTPVQTQEIQTVEVPTIALPEPEPIVVYEPAPVYEPPVYAPVQDYWPEPDTPITTWAPIRK